MSPDPDKTEYLRLGLQELERGGHDTALRFFEKILAADPADPQGLFYAGKCRYLMNDPEAARRCLEPVVERDLGPAVVPDAPGEAHLWLARCLLEKDVEKALETALKGIDLQPGGVLLQNIAGNCHFRLKRYEDALKHYDRAAQLEGASPAYPDYPGRLAYNRASALTRLKRYEEALRAIEEAIGKDAKQALFYNQKAVILGDGAKDFAGAVEASRQAIALDPEMHQTTGDGVYYYNLALYLSKLGQKREALEPLRRALSFKPDEKDYADLKRELEQALSLPSSDAKDPPSLLDAAGLCVLKIAKKEARAAGRNFMEPGHLYLALCKIGDFGADELAAKDWISTEDRNGARDALGVLEASFLAGRLEAKAFRRRLRALLDQGLPGPKTNPVANDDLLKVLARANEISRPHKASPSHLLAALLEMESADPPWRLLYKELGVDRERLGRSLPQPHKEGAPARQGGAPPTPTLDAFGRDITRQAQDGKLSPLVGRKEELKRLARVLLQSVRNNAILVGEPGVGKTCLVEGLAQKLAGPRAPAELKGLRFIELNISEIVAGTKFRGEFEERLRKILGEAASSKDIVLFLDEIHTVIGAGSAEGTAGDAADMLKPALARGDLRVIGATTTAEYRKHIETDPAFQRRFETITLEEPTTAEALEMLSALRPRLEKHHGVQITDGALRAAVELSARHIKDRRLPDKAITLIDQACARARFKSFSSFSDPAGSRSKVDEGDVASLVAEICAIPVDRLRSSEAAKLLGLEEALRARVIGQEEALREVSGLVRASLAGLKDAGKPRGVFLFLGATGVGKTETAKALAQFLFGDEEKLLRFDMSEYQEKHSVAKLIGSPPGYVGHEEEGVLTGKIRSHPYSVLLFDEIEKAHPQVYDIFLQIFDDGRLTDSKGRTVSFDQTFIIMTSNLGSSSEKPAKEIGFRDGAKEDDEPSAKRRYLEAIGQAVTRTFRPEFINRISKQVVFFPLERKHAGRILEKFLTQLEGRLKEKGLTLRVAPEARELLLKEGFSTAFGARELGRAVESRLSEPLAKMLINGGFKSGQTVEASARGTEILLAPAADQG